MKDRDNQQQTVSDFEIGWLAGIIEGEGSICLQIHKRKDRSQQLRVTPKVIWTNSDMVLIEKSVSILERLKIGKWVHHTRPNNVSTLFKLNGKHTPKFKDVAYIHVSGMKRVQKLLSVISDHIAGEKKERAIILGNFIKRRLSNGTNSNGRPSNYSYDDEDVSMMLDFLRLTKSPNYDKIVGMLNEHTREAKHRRRLQYRRNLYQSKKEAACSFG